MKKLAHCFAFAFLLACWDAHAAIQFNAFPIGSTPVGSSDYTWCDQSGVSNRCLFYNIFGSPPPIGSGTPNTGAFTTVNLSGVLTLGTILGTTQCLEANTSGQVIGTGIPCGSGSGGGGVITQNAQGCPYTFQLSDANTIDVYLTCTSGGTVTIPANASVAYPLETCLLVTSDATSTNITIAITSDTLIWSPTVTQTGSRTLSPTGIVTICKKKTTTWFISGSGLT